MPTLYRQYRPQTFAGLFGQEHIAQTLRQAIEKNRIAHAYLFHGPRGTGKTTTARILAKRLNCTNAKGAEPCGTCKLCQATQEGTNIDVIEIDAASNRGIDDIRALKDGIGLAPAMSKYKVYIVDEVHMLTNEAFTALLKTLEEPSAHAVFILATTELHKVPETILSRCQVYRFRRATPQELERRLTFLLEQEKREAEAAALQFIISHSDGCFRDAESLLGQMLTLHDQKITEQDVTEFLGLPPSSVIDELLLALVNGQSTPALTALETAFASGFDPEQLIKESITRARDGAVALAKNDATTAAFVHPPHAAARLPLIIRALVQALQDLAYVPQPIIALQVAILSVCTHAGKPKPATVTTPAKPVITTPVAALKSAVTPEQVKNIWPQLIANIKAKNPVAATFLRAIEPQAVEGNNVRLRASYALHRNFFDKPENKALIEGILSELVGVPLTINCFIDQPISGSSVTWSPTQPQPEQDLLAAVKEVFGTGK